MKKSIFRKEVLEKIQQRHYGQVFNKKKFPWVVPVLFILAAFMIFIAIDMDIIGKIDLGIKAFL